MRAAFTEVEGSGVSAGATTLPRFHPGFRVAVMLGAIRAVLGAEGFLDGRPLQ